jgi:hypothetical protein
MNMERLDRNPADTVSIVASNKPWKAVWALRARLGDVPLHEAGEIPETDCKGGIYQARHPAAGVGVARFNINFRGAFSVVYHDFFYTLMRRNAGDDTTVACTNHVERSQDSKQWSFEKILAFMRAKIGSTMLRDDRPRVLDAALERGVFSPSEAELQQIACSLTYADNAAKIGSTMLRDDMARVLAAATKQGVDSSSEAARLQIARSLTNADNAAKIGSTMLLDEMPRVLAAATKRGVDSSSEAARLQIARSLTNADNSAKVGSAMLANDPDRVHAEATALGIDVGDDNALGRVAMRLQLVENRWKGQFGDKVIAYFKYKDDRGDFPTVSGDNPQLGKWAENQRSLKRKFDRGEPAKGMCSERVSMLTAQGFVWDVRMGR